MGFNWAEKFSEGRRIRQRVPVLGYRVPLFQNLQVKIKRFRLALRIIVVCLNPLCDNAPTGLVIYRIYPVYRSTLCIAQLAEHWASIPEVVASIPTVDRHIFSSLPGVDIHSE